MDNHYVIGHVGRFQYQKNHEFLIDIFNAYLKLDDQAILMLIGQGEGEENIKKKVSDLGIEENVRFMGVRSDVNQLFQAMDTFVLPSRFEGLPLVLIEAQTAALKRHASKDAITADSDITGHVEFIPLADNAAEWAQKIYESSQVADDRAKWSQLVIDAGFDIHTETDKFIAYLEESL